ncbi:MAG: hypothetical protein RLZZ474_1608 [Bacteroidota bacterium]
MCVRILCFISFLLISLPGNSQKIRFASSIGTSTFQWYENQTTVDVGAQLTFQHPKKKYQIFAKLKALGNLHDSSVNRDILLFMEPPVNKNNKPLAITDPMYAAYRGGQAEAGIQWNSKSGLSPSIALYSKSLARKISTSQSQYIEEEKYALHGMNVGLAYKATWKESAIQFSGQIFEPLIQRITLYGRYVGVPYTSKASNHSLSYRATADFHYQKMGLSLTYEILNFGAAENINSKSIDATQAQILSTLFTYYF